MLLLSDDPREPACRQRLVDWLGKEDATTLVLWVKDTHRSQGVEFGQALTYVVEQTEISGVRFAKNLLEVAKKPKAVREAEVEVLSWVKPRVERAAAMVMGFRGDPEVAKIEFTNFCEELTRQINRWWPGKHEATVRGALLSACQHQNGSFTVNVAALVAALDPNDPMSVFYSKT